MNIINEFFVSFILIKLYFKFKVCRKIKFPLLWKFYFSKWKFYFSADSMIGEHGDSQFAALSNASVLGQNLLDFYKQKLGKNLDIQELEKAVISEGYFIYERKGRTEFGIGTSCANLAKAILEDRKSLHPVSVVFDDIAFSMPAIIGKDGIEKVFELKFNEKEKTKLENSKQQIKNAIQSVKDEI